MGGPQGRKTHGVQTLTTVIEDHKELAHNLSPFSRVSLEGVLHARLVIRAPRSFAKLRTGKCLFSGERP
jgi:hypothetical protein